MLFSLAKVSRAGLSALLLLALSGCSTLGYYSQAVRGHLDLRQRRVPIEQLLADQQTPAALRQRLATVQQIRGFAIDQMRLPDNGSYLTYADLERDAVTWLVSAAPELSLQPERWCYLFVGCLSYRGYFDQLQAERFADALRADGLETAITPSPAYSTLGRFADPVLNTMLAYDDAQLAGLLFHELAHQVVYLKGDAMFSESFATAVERLGRQRWAQRRELDLGAVNANENRELQFSELLLTAREALEAIYQQAISDQLKRQQKQQLLQRLREDYAALKQQWDGYTGFDHWFADGGPNNARLALLATYELQVPAFEQLFAQHDEDWSSFYAAVRELARLGSVERNERLRELAQPALQ